MKKVVVVSAYRTPVGKIPGSLNGLDDVSLMAYCFAETVKRCGIESKSIDDAYVGCSFPGDRDNICRKSILAAGLSQTIPGTSITRTCASSMEALSQGAYKIMAGDAEIVIVGGVESMSNSGYALSYFKKNIKAMLKKQLPSYKAAIEGLEENETVYISEMLARKYNISRQAQDIYAMESHKRAWAAQKTGRYNDELIPINLSIGEKNIELQRDENIIEDLTLEILEKENAIFTQDGMLSRINSAPIGDGAAAIILMSEERARSEGLLPLAEIDKMAVIGLTREKMGHGTVEVVKSILQHKNMSINDIDLFECNESFAVKSILCRRLLNIPSDKFNVNGGSIALGYPVGCTGLRICVTLIHEMSRKHSEYGIAAICAGGCMGQGILFKNMR